MHLSMASFLGRKEQHGNGHVLRFASVPPVMLNSKIFPGRKAVHGETALGSNFSLSRYLHPSSLSISPHLGSLLSNDHLLMMPEEFLRTLQHQGADFNGLLISQWKWPEAHSFG